MRDETKEVILLTAVFIFAVAIGLCGGASITEGCWKRDAIKAGAAHYEISDTNSGNTVFKWGK